MTVPEVRGPTAQERVHVLREHLAFDGHWPERSAFLDTAKFKEFEAYTVLGRMPDNPAV
jgi:cysteate synthase